MSEKEGQIIGDGSGWHHGRRCGLRWGGWRKRRGRHRDRGTGAVALVHASPFLKMKINREAGKLFAGFTV